MNQAPDDDARRFALASLPWLAGPLGDGWQIGRGAALVWDEARHTSVIGRAVTVTWTRSE